MYCRISAELQCAALRIIGCPPHGYVEMKADDLFLHNVLVITRKGHLWATFLMGLLQGSGFSVATANPVVELKYLAWRLHRCNLQEGLMDTTDPRLHAYHFTHTDPQDGTSLQIWAGGHCDDNI